MQAASDGVYSAKKAATRAAERSSKTAHKVSTGRLRSSNSVPLVLTYRDHKLLLCSDALIIDRLIAGPTD